MVILSSLFLFACNNDDKEIKGNFDGQPITFDTQIVNQTRAYGTTWEQGDAIGIYMKTAGTVLSSTSVIEANKKHTTPGDGKFSFATAEDRIYFPENGSNVDFIAYYPYRTITDFMYPVEVGGNQGGKLADIDLMYSNNLTDKNNTSNDATLGFSHQLATIVLNMVDKAGNSLENMSVTITGMKIKSSFSLVDAGFTDDATTGEIGAAMSINNTQATAQAIVIPAKGVTGAKILFTIPSYGKTYEWAIPDNQDFDSKNKYSYNVEVTDGGLTVLNPNSTITDWTDNSGGTIEIGEDGSSGGTGTQANPYTVDQLSEKVGETAKWVEGYIVGSTAKTRAVGTPSTENILIAADADETDEARCIPVDISTSAVKANLDIVANPELIGKKIKLQGDIVNNIFSNTLSMTNITDQEGGATVGSGGELEFYETFGPTWRTSGQTGTQTKTWVQYLELDQFDMKNPIVYSTGTDPVDLRSTATYDNPHVWFAANYDKLLKIEGIESGYTGMKLSYDIACNLQAGGAPAEGILVKCNGVDVPIPSTTLGAQNIFSTITMDIPDGTTTIEFYSTPTSNPTNYGYRLDNIKITGTK